MGCPDSSLRTVLATCFISRGLTQQYAEFQQINYNHEEQIKAAKEKREPLILPHFSCHHLRHTFATKFCENEINLKVIQSVMGHANIETTMDIYAEATERKKQESMKKLSEKFDVN